MDKKDIDTGALDDFGVDFLIAEARKFLEHAYEDFSKALKMRLNNEKMDNECTVAFFRSKGRLDNIKLVLQYLIYYTKEVDVKKEKKEDIIKPFEQFRESVHFLYSLMGEADVQKAIFREYIRVTPLEIGTFNKFEHEILGKQKDLLKMISRADSPRIESFHTLFDSLEKYSEYWFEIKDNNFARIRKSDVYIFELARLLREKMG
ncbi:MAG: hypothetical protein GY757_10595 [bacterium]|nr:hypothetical protein [bacterium]